MWIPDNTFPAQLMRWVICKEQSLWASSQRIHFLSYTQFIATWESSNLTWLRLLFQKYRNEGEFKKIASGLSHSLHFAWSVSYWACICRATQNWTALAGLGNILPNAATLITVSPSDLTLMFLLLACWLAESPGQQEGTAVQTFTLLPSQMAEKHAAPTPTPFCNFYKDSKDVKSLAWKVKVVKDSKMLLNRSTMSTDSFTGLSFGGSLIVFPMIFNP